MPTESQPPKIFISYSHDTPEHADRVMKLSDALCQWGIDCHIDQYELAPANWLRWMERQIKDADSVLIICTETYCRRFEGRETRPSGVGWEGGVISVELYQRQDEAAKFIPVVFSLEDAEHIPTVLRATHRHHINIEKLDVRNPKADPSTERLYRHLAKMPSVVKPKIGKMLVLPPINQQEDSDNKEIEDISNEVIAKLTAKSSKPKAVQPTSNMNLSEDLGNDIKLAVMAIPGGSFLMGSEEYDDEKPIHRVTLSPFHIGKHQVTQAQWQAVMKNNPSLYKGDNLPVEHVSWEDASSFCQKLTEKTGREYRLPTEAEWEYACRTGSTGRYCFGDNNALLQKYAWYRKNAEDKTHPIGEKLANDWGLHDMHGNVWEWCQDWYDEDYYWESPEENPQGPSPGTHRVLRGGSFSHDKDQCCSASRGSYTPDTIYRYLGLRVVCVARTS
ncbi:MAG: SUMF1/EgtB/PvdO family nonheme iron enzyme [Acidobacteriota bacterium]|nr:SUMF1/EgtB/PvdO family nonheme iron enzyme [Acidobacteriota bacterium]